MGGVARALAAPVPKETGLSFEGLLKGEPGFQPRQPAPLPVAEVPGFLTRAQLAHSYAVYRKDFVALLAAETSLKSAARDSERADDHLALRKQQIVSANSVLLHEFYFRNLALERVDPPNFIQVNMAEHMGTMATWSADFVSCARVADAWAVLVYDPYDDRWHNLPLGAMSAAGMVGGNPLVVCKVSEDTWSLDYDDRETYVDRFIEHIDWNVVATRYRAVDRR